MFISTSELIKKTYKLYAENFILFLQYIIIISAPLFITNTLVAISQKLNLTILYTLFSYFSIIAIMLSLWFANAFIKDVSDRYNGKNPENIVKIINGTKKFTISSLISLFFCFMFFLVVFGILMSVEGFIGLFGGSEFLFFSIMVNAPILILFSLFAFYPFIIVLENKRSIKSLKESTKMIRTKGESLNIFLKLYIPLFILSLPDYFNEITHLQRITTPILLTTISNMLSFNMVMNLTGHILYIQSIPRIPLFAISNIIALLMIALIPYYTILYNELKKFKQTQVLK